MKIPDPTGLRGVNGFSHEVHLRAMQEKQRTAPGRPQRAIRIALIAILLSLLCTYGILYAILTPTYSHQVRTK